MTRRNSRFLTLTIHNSHTTHKRAFGKKNVAYRSCHAEWFTSWPWLHYEEDKDTVLCHVCPFHVESEMVTETTKQWQ